MSPRISRFIPSDVNLVSLTVSFPLSSSRTGDVSLIIEVDAGFFNEADSDGTRFFNEVDSCVADDWYHLV